MFYHSIFFYYIKQMRIRKMRQFISYFYEIKIKNQFHRLPTVWRSLLKLFVFYIWWILWRNQEFDFIFTSMLNDLLAHWWSGPVDIRRDRYDIVQPPCVYPSSSLRNWERIFTIVLHLIITPAEDVTFSFQLEHSNPPH